MVRSCVLGARGKWPNCFVSQNTFDVSIGVGKTDSLTLPSLFLIPRGLLNAFDGNAIQKVNRLYLKRSLIPGIIFKGLTSLTNPDRINSYLFFGCDLESRPSAAILARSRQAERPGGVG